MVLSVLTGCFRWTSCGRSRDACFAFCFPAFLRLEISIIISALLVWVPLLVWDPLMDHRRSACPFCALCGLFWGCIMLPMGFFRCFFFFFFRRCVCFPSFDPLGWKDTLWLLIFSHIILRLRNLITSWIICTFTFAM